MSDPRVRRRLRIRGRVQGVGFRYATAEAARGIDVAGFVRNRPDGSVEAVFEGTPAAVDAAATFCATGPCFARVDGVETSEEPPEGLTEFTIR